jgi:pimeloyl-ACP methyl ester carboxylesterase
VGDPGAAHEIRAVIDAARSLPQPVARRGDVTAHFVARGLSEGIGRWMTTNIARAPDGLRWRFDLDAIEAMLVGYWAEDLWPFIEAPGSSEVRILRGGRSDRWSADDVARLDRLPHARLLPDAGHWVHVDDAAGVLAALSESMA